jgi:TP901 family phage tail tape measure protein
MGFGKADAAQDKFTKNNDRAANQLAKVGVGMAAAGLGIAAGFGVAINSAANFEERISAVKAVSGATEAELDKIRQKALQLGSDTKYSATEAALAMEELVKAGLTVDDVLNGAAEATVNLAAAGEIELPRAAEVAANAMSAFNLAAEDLPHVADLIAGAANASAISVEEFAQSMQQSSAVANLAGFSFDDLAVAIAAMGNAGIKGSDAGTSLKTFLQNLQPVTAKQIDLFRELGIVTEEGTNLFYDQAGSVKPLAEVAQVLQDALAGMTDQQKQMALETLFGSDAIRAAAIIADEGAAGFNELAAAMGKVTAEEVAETRMDNLKGSIEQLKGSVETLLIIIGQPLAESLRVWVDRLTELINAFSGLDEAQRNDIVTILQMASAFLTTLGTLALIASGIIKAKAAAVALSVVFGSIGAVAFAVVAVLLAVGAALVVLYQRNERFREIVQGVWEWIRTNVLSIIEEVRAGVTAMVDAFNGEGLQGGGGIVGFFETLGVAARHVVDWITGTLIPAFKSFADFIMTTVVPAIVWLASEVRERLDSAFGWVQDNVFPVIESFGELVAAFVSFVIDRWNMIYPVVRGVFQAVVVTIQTALKIIERIIQFTVGNVLTWWNEFGDNIWEVIQIAWNHVIAVIEAALQIIRGIIQIFTGIFTGDWSKVWEGIKNVFSGAWNFMVSTLQFTIALIGQIIEIGIGLIKVAWSVFWSTMGLLVDVAWLFIKNIVTTGIALIRGAIETGINVIKTIWNTAWSLISTVFRNAWEAIKSAATAALTIFVALFIALPGRILAALGGMITLLYQRGRDVVQGLLNGAQNTALAVLAWFASLPGSILGWVGSLASTLYQAGRDLIGGFIDGIQAMAQSVADAASSVAAGAENAVRRALGIASPSKVFHDIGLNVMSGMEKGLLQGWQPVEGQFSHMMAMVTAPPPSPQMPASGGGGDVHVHIHLPAGMSAEEARAQITDPDTLRQLANAVRAGSRS